MPLNHRSIFRESAIQRYRMRREQDVLPRFLAPPLFTFLWILLGLCLVGGWLAWNTRVPMYAAASGVLVQSQPTGQLQALLFASAEQQTALRAGQAVQLHIGTTGPQLHVVVTSVTSHTLSPEQIRTDYHLDSTLSLAVSQPALVITVLIGNNAIRPEYIGSLVSAEIQVGSRSALSLLTLSWIMR